MKIIPKLSKEELELCEEVRSEYTETGYFCVNLDKGFKISKLDKMVKCGLIKELHNFRYSFYFKYYIPYDGEIPNE